MSISSKVDEGERPQSSGRRTGRSFYAAPVSEFRITDDDAIIGRLSSRHVAFHAAAEAEQLRAWAREIEILKESFAKLGSLCDDWQLLLEIPPGRQPSIGPHAGTGKAEGRGIHVTVKITSQL